MLTSERTSQGKHHYLGGRFVPTEIRDKFALRLPPFPGSAQCVRIGAREPVQVADIRGSDARLGEAELRLESMHAVRDASIPIRSLLRTRPCRSQHALLPPSARWRRAMGTFCRTHERHFAACR